LGNVWWNIPVYVAGTAKLIPIRLEPMRDRAKCSRPGMQDWQRCSERNVE